MWGKTKSLTHTQCGDALFGNDCTLAAGSAGSAAEAAVGLSTESSRHAAIPAEFMIPAVDFITHVILVG
jgi:hypothetical protein